MRVLLDTNVLVSAFTTRGLCADVFRLVVAEHDLLVAAVVEAELKRVLRQRFHVPVEGVEEILSLLRGFEAVPKPARGATPKVRDPDDAWVLASALAAKADVLVTGDRDLLVLKPLPRLHILGPRGFWNLARAPTEQN